MKYAVAGLGSQVDLPVPLVIDLMPVGQTNQRPGITRERPGYWVQHETANTNAGADAAMHSRYLHAGANGSQVSWHFTVDDHQIRQNIPVSEVTWQAADGAGPGNMSGVSCEMCVNSDGDEAKARHNTEALCAAICTALGDIPISRVKRHYDFNAADPDRHHCPDHMMNDNYWPTFLANVEKLMTPVPAPSHPKPHALPFRPGVDWAPVAVKDVWWFPLVFQAEVVKRVVPRIYGSTKAPAAGDTLTPQTIVKCVGYVKDKTVWYIREDGARLAGASLTPALSVKNR